MNIICADSTQLDLVKKITKETITQIYPYYYTKSNVDFFLSHHNDKNISDDIQSGHVFILYNDENTAVGTITIKGNEISRLFVLPPCQKHGFGRELMDFAEIKISERYKTSRLDASIPAKEIYRKRGYMVTEARSVQTDSGDLLCYDIMCKNLNPGESK